MRQACRLGKDLAYAVIKPFHHVAQHAVFFVLVEYLMVQTCVDAQRFVRGGHLFKHVDAILGRYQAVVATVQKNDRIGEVGRVFAQPNVSLVHGAQQCHGELLHHEGVG